MPACSSIVMRRNDAQLVLGRDPSVDAAFDLHGSGVAEAHRRRLGTLAHRGERLVRVYGPSPQEAGTIVDVTLAEAPLWAAMVDYAWRILTFSITLSLVVAALLFLSLRMVVVRPLHRITAQLAAFRHRPEDSAADTAPQRRGDEIGIVEAERLGHALGAAQSLVEKTRLAAVGAAVSRINHDLRNSLATAVLISDRLEGSADPAVRQVAPRLIEALDRGIRDLHGDPKLRPQRRAQAATGAGQAGRAARAGPRRPRRPGAAPALECRARARASTVLADADQLFRIFLNLARNAAEAMPAGGTISVTANVSPSPARDRAQRHRPGIPARARPQLFEPFAGSSKPDGSGLGLAICRELARAHGGDVELVSSSAAGTRFRLTLPPRLRVRAAAARRTKMPANASSRIALLLAACSALASCSWPGPGLAGYSGLQFKTKSYYDRHAWERNASCPTPRMQAIIRTEVVEDTPERLVLNLRYRWRDEGQSDKFGVDVTSPLAYCNGWSERTFTFTKKTGGDLDVAAMTGPQRRQRDRSG